MKYHAHKRPIKHHRQDVHYKSFRFMTQEICPQILMIIIKRRQKPCSARAFVRFCDSLYSYHDFTFLPTVLG